MSAASSPSPPRIPPRDRLRQGALSFAALTSIGLVGVFAIGAQGAGPAPVVVLHPGFLILALVCAVADLALGGLRFHVFIRSRQPRLPFGLSIRADLAGRFLGAVTPSQTGGGPAQIFVLHRGGVPVPEVLSLLLINFISTLVVLLTAGGLSAWLLRERLGDGALLRLTQTGLCLAILLLGAMVIVLLRPQVLARAVAPLARRPAGGPGRRPGVLAKAARFLVDNLEQYRVASHRFVWERPWLPATSLALTAAMYLNKFGLAWLVMRGLGIESDLLTTIALMALINIGLLLAPSPGGSGIGELATGASLTAVLPGSLAGLFTLVYRLILIYLPAAAGAGVLLTEFDPRRTRTLVRASAATLWGLVLVLGAATSASAQPACPLCGDGAPPIVVLSSAEIEAAAESLAARNHGELDRIDALFQAGRFGPPASREARARAQLLARVGLANWYAFMLPYVRDPERVRSVTPEVLAPVAARYCEALALPIPRLRELRMGRGYVCARYDLGGNPEEGSVVFGGRRLNYRVGDRQIDSRHRRVLGLDWPNGDVGKIELIVEEHYGFRLAETRSSDEDGHPCDLFLALDVAGGWVRHCGVHRPAAFAFWATRFEDRPPGAPGPLSVGAAIYVPGLRFKLPLLPDVELSDLRTLSLPMPFLDADDLRRGALPSWLQAEGQARLTSWVGQGSPPPVLREYFPERRGGDASRLASAAAVR